MRAKNLTLKGLTFMRFSENIVNRIVMKMRNTCIKDFSSFIGILAIFGLVVGRVRPFEEIMKMYLLLFLQITAACFSLAESKKSLEKKTFQEKYQYEVDIQDFVKF